MWLLHSYVCVTVYIILQTGLKDWAHCIVLPHYVKWKILETLWRSQFDRRSRWKETSDVLSTLKYISFYSSISTSYVTFSPFKLRTLCASFGCPITLQENLGQIILWKIKSYYPSIHPSILLYQSILLASLVCLAPHAHPPSAEFL